MKRFGLRSYNDYNKDVLSKEDYLAVKEFVSNEDIVVRKADKSNTFVILDRSDYYAKLDSIIDDVTKFKMLSKDPTDALKSKLNKIVTSIHSLTHDLKISKLIGSYSPGYLYGNPKTHKNTDDPPLRPIISQIGTPTYEIAKLLNNILTKYMPAKYSIKSTSEFIDIAKNVNKRGLLASLDVESLFTNVPVITTIDIILDNAYNNAEIAPPPIPKDLLKELLTVCTTETPFKHPNGNIYKQVEGVSMGSPLGPLFANFYMADLENGILQRMCNNEAPIVYCRYVDDIFLVVKNVKTVYSLKKQFEQNSVLKFTYEIKLNEISFLDVEVSKAGDHLSTKVHVKPTSTGDCINYNSIAPDQYKIGAIKTMLHRANRVCSDRVSFYREVNRLKHLFTNNNFPMKIIQNVINKFVSRHIENRPENQCDTETEKIHLYYRNQMSSYYKQEELNLKRIVSSHVFPTDENKSISLQIYYKNKKVRNLFIKNNPHVSSDNHVVYRYTCAKEECQLDHQTYIGYTTTTVKQRMTTHAQNGSIKNHNNEAHSINIRTKEIINEIDILFRSADKVELQIAEALLIKLHNPPLNNQSATFTRTLNVF